MEEEIKVEETKVVEKIKPNWADTVQITIPLSEYFKKVRKIEKLKKKYKQEYDWRWKEYDKRIAAEKALNALREDYQKLLGMKEGEADDAE